jgi:hypothetical protein
LFGHEPPPHNSSTVVDHALRAGDHTIHWPRVGSRKRTSAGRGTPR